MLQNSYPWKTHTNSFIEKIKKHKNDASSTHTPKNVPLSNYSLTTQLLQLLATCHPLCAREFYRPYHFLGLYDMLEALGI
jgi:hypothetical protein